MTYCSFSHIFHTVNSQSLIFRLTNNVLKCYGVVINVAIELVAFSFLFRSVRVSNELGQGHPRATKYSVYITVIQSLLIGIICMIAVLITKNEFAIIFTSSKEMQRAVAELAYLLGLTMILNSIQPVISGTACWTGIPIYLI